MGFEIGNFIGIVWKLKPKVMVEFTDLVVTKIATSGAKM